MWFLFVFAVIALLFMFPLQMTRILAGSAIAGVAIGGYFYWEKTQSEGQKAAVEVSVKYDTETCNPSQPLLITIVNGASYPVAKVEWVFSARRPGNRSEMTGEWLQPNAIVQLISPGEQYTSCYAAPRPGKHASRNSGADPSELELGVRSRKIEFVKD
jgi:hypothetical protein